jgi:hypothetical protein
MIPGQVAVLCIGKRYGADTCRQRERPGREIASAIERINDAAAVLDSDD